MKKSSIWFTIFTLVFVLGMSYLCTEYIFPFFQNNYTYSQTQCLTDSVTEDMDEYAIGNMYRDGGATARVVISYNGTEYSWGSGVCVASNGYTTTSLSTNVTASKGSYFATNYHVIEDKVTSSGFSVKVEVQDKDENGDLSYPSYSASVLWYNKDLDVAIVYTEYNFGYVAMRDSWIEYDENGRQSESGFVIGTPLEDQYRFRITTGGIGASISGLYANTLKTVEGHEVVDNFYEDGMDLSADIAPGNSGGGVFDKKGRLVGLATFTATYSNGGNTAFNGATPIYPIMKVLDKVIDNNENNAGHKIYDLEKLNIKGYDGNEAYAIKDKQGYLDGNYYSSVTFEDYGYYIFSSSIGLSKVAVENVELYRNGENIAEAEILDRNDLIFILLKANAGDKLIVTYKSTTGLITGTKTKEITLS